MSVQDVQRKKNDDEMIIQGVKPVRFEAVKRRREEQESSKISLRE